MNNTAKTLIPALIAGTVLVTAAWMLKPTTTSAAAVQVVQLEPVLITGKRIQEGVQELRVAQLPQVIVVGKRLPADAGTALAQAPRAAIAKV